MGDNINKAAQKAFDEFIKKNPGCAALAKQLGLDKFNVTDIDAKGDEKLLNTALKDLNFPKPFPDGSDSQNSVELNQSLRQKLTRQGNFGGAVANIKTNTIYYEGTEHPAGFGFVIFHELLRIAYNGEHGMIAGSLGIYTPRAFTDSKGKSLKLYDDADAAGKLYEFMKNGCQKEEQKKKQ